MKRAVREMNGAPSDLLIGLIGLQRTNHGVEAPVSCESSGVFVALFLRGLLEVVNNKL
jgi:hypothetical protein